MESSKKISEQLLDAAACDALGASSPTESAAYQQELASTGEEARRIDRDLRETVARMAAASPHMNPPEDLRGRILQATAPVTFKMEDYRKATKEPSRFYKWGFYAAMLFLMAGAYYNLSMQTALKNGNETVKQIAAQSQERDTALATLLDPNCQTVTFKDGQGTPYGRAWVNEKTQRAVVILAEECVPKGKTGHLSMPGPDGKPIAYQTVLITAPAASFVPGKILPTGQSFETTLAIKDMSPDLDARHPLETRPQVASQGIGGK